MKSITTQALLLLTTMLLVVILAMLALTQLPAALAWRALGDRVGGRGNQLTRLAQRLRDADARCDAALAIVTERR